MVGFSHNPNTCTPGTFEIEKNRNCNGNGQTQMLILHESDVKQCRTA